MDPRAIQPGHRYRTPEGEIRRVKAIDEGVVLFTSVAYLNERREIAYFTSRLLPLSRFASDVVREVMGVRAA